ncbi:MAG: hypothetical protein PHS11_07875, partial [Eubacteriales bacterium]|nr:hypothetical protein [Eubacteriales bacterium]
MVGFMPHFGFSKQIIKYWKYVKYGELAQLGERVVRKATCNRKERITKTGNNVKYGELAQLGER